MEELSQKALSRREFSVAAALAALSGVAITITSCGGGGGGSPTASSGGGTAGGSGYDSTTGSSAGDRVGQISSNHGHAAVITGAQLTAGGALKLDITGTATHSHSVELTAAEVTAIAGGTKTSKESSTDSSHSHTVTFN
jgi:hypothetical protein